MSEIIQSRRGFITGLIAFVAAPAIVRVSSIMPVKAMEPSLLPPGMYTFTLKALENYNETDARFTCKLWQHAQNYGMGTDKFQQIIRAQGL